MTLRFEEGDDFKTNLERFLAHMESEDREMGASFAPIPFLS